LIAELLVHRRRVFQARRVSNDEARIDVAGFDPVQKRLRVGLNTRLSLLDVTLFMAAPNEILSPKVRKERSLYGTDV